MRVYVATKYAHKNQAAEAAAILREHDHTITYAWWSADDGNLTAEACNDYNGVLAADAIVMIPAVGGKASWVEVGLMMGFAYVDESPRHVVLVGDREAPGGGMIFEHLPADFNIHRVATVREAAELLSSLEPPQESFVFPERNDDL